MTADNYDKIFWARTKYKLLLAAIILVVASVLDYFFKFL